MKPSQLFFRHFAACFLLTLSVPAAPAADCSACHAKVYSKWAAGAHANTQADVAAELSQSDAGLTPQAVVQEEDCLACHGPVAVQANGGMTEAQALGYFFSATNGMFSADTTATHTSDWPHLACPTCHNVPADHPTTMPALALFNSQNGQYVAAANTSALCGQCHGNLHFAGTDHLTWNAWAKSAHANTQKDVADELSQVDAGMTPADVTQQENCIGCHAPTAVLANGGMTESQALNYFFSSAGGVFTADTVVANSDAWPSVGCLSCHDPHDPGKLSYFNSATQQYQVMANSAQLCGQCHGNLRFAGTDHLTYNIMTGTGGVGVPDQQMMPGVTCTDCHMHSSDVDGSNSMNFHGHSWAITVTEPDGSTTTSCAACHSTLDTAAANASIAAAKAEFQALDATVSAKIAQAAAALQDATNSTWLAALQEAQHNLSYAESDESGGFHNHKYLMALLNDANLKVQSLPLLAANVQGTNIVISWTASGALESAAAVTGPWITVTNAASPLVIRTWPQPSRQFYRLRFEP